MGRAWVTDSREEQEERLLRPLALLPVQVLRYMGTDSSLQGTPMASFNLPEVCAAIWKQVRPEGLSPDTTIMVLKSELPSKLPLLATVLLPCSQ